MDNESKDHSFYIERATKEIKKRLSVNDLVSRLVNLVDGTEKAENNIFEALFDMYFLYFPEAAFLLKERDKFIDAVKDGELRDRMASVLGIKSSEMGYDLSENDLKLMHELIQSILRIRELSNSISLHMETVIKSNFPNLQAVAGTLVSARLLLLSGGIKRLSSMPSSKIQVLGAEKGLFLNSKRTPKYGVIFLHPSIENASPKRRGKIARIIASYISLAAKLDYFSEKGLSSGLIDKMNSKIKRVT